MDDSYAAYLRKQADINMAKLRSHETVQRLLNHQTVLSLKKQPYLNDPIVLAAIGGLVIILLIFACACILLLT